jgi:hypothetical protein
MFGIALFCRVVAWLFEGRTSVVALALYAVVVTIMLGIEGNLSLMFGWLLWLVTALLGLCLVFFRWHRGRNETPWEATRADAVLPAEETSGSRHPTRTDGRTSSTGV